MAATARALVHVAGRAADRAACRGRRPGGRAARPAVPASRGCRTPPTAAVPPSASCGHRRDGDPSGAAARPPPSGEPPRGRHQIGKDRVEIGRQRVACVHSHTPSSRDLRIFRARDTRIRAAGPLMPRPAATAPKSRSDDDPQLERAPLAGVEPGELGRERARQLGRVRARGHLVPVGVVIRAGGDAEPLDGAPLEPRPPVVLADEVARDPPQPRHAGAGLAPAEAPEPEQRLREGLGRQLARCVRRYLSAQPRVERGRPAAVERLEGRRVGARRAQLRGVRHHCGSGATPSFCNCDRRNAVVRRRASDAAAES